MPSINDIDSILSGAATSSTPRTIQNTSGGFSPSINDIDTILKSSQQTPSIENIDTFLADQPVQEQPYTGVIEEGSPLSFGQRAKTSFGDTEGIKDFVRTIGYEPLEDEQGNILVKKDDKVFRLDEAGTNIKDVADMVGKAFPLVGSILGAIGGGIAGGGPLSPGTAALGGAAGGFVGGGIGETIRQTLGKALGVNAPGGGAGEIAKESVYGGIGGLTAGVGSVLARGATRLAPEVLGRVGVEGAGTLLGKSAEPIGTMLAEKVVPRLGTKLAGEAVEAGLQGGIISGGQTLVDTGDVGQAAKAFGEGALLSAPFGPLGYAALSPISKAIEGRVIKTGIPRGKWYAQIGDPQSFGGGKFSEAVAFVEPIENVLEGAGAVGKLAKAEGREQIFENDRLKGVALEVFNNSRNRRIAEATTPEEIKEAIMIAVNSNRLGKVLGPEDIPKQTSNPKVQKLLLEAYEGSKNISQTKVDAQATIKTAAGETFTPKKPGIFFPIVYVDPSDTNLDKMVANILKEKRFVKLAQLDPILAADTAEREAQKRLKRIRGIRETGAREETYTSIADMEAHGIETDWDKAWSTWINREARRASILKVFGKDFNPKVDLPPVIPSTAPVIHPTMVTGKFVLPKDVISVNEVEDLLSDAGYKRMEMRKLTDDLTDEIGTKINPDPNVDNRLEFANAEKLQLALDRELPKYGKVGEPTKISTEQKITKVITPTSVKYVKTGGEIEQPSYKLPKGLEKASPKGYGKSEIIFESDVDKALYIIAQTKKSAADSKYMDWLKTVFPDKDEMTIRKMGGKIKAAIKDIAQAKPNETVITIPKTAEPKAKVTSSKLEPLAQEARKYKSAEEFVKAQVDSNKAGRFIKEKDFVVKDPANPQFSGKFSEYALDGSQRKGKLSVEKSKSGWRVRNIFVDDGVFGENLRRKGIATDTYRNLNEQSILDTGKPLRSSDVGYARKTSVTTLSDNGESVWKKLVANGEAEKVGDNYQFKTKSQLTDIYNQAQGGIVNKLTQPTAGKILVTEAPLATAKPEIPDEIEEATVEGFVSALLRKRQTNINKILDEKYAGKPDLAETWKQYVNTYYDVLEGKNQTNSFVSLIKQLNALKMSMSFIANFTQPLNISMITDFPIFGRAIYGGWKAMLGGDGLSTELSQRLAGKTAKELTIESGSSAQRVLDTDTENAMQKFINTYLTPLTKGERFNRLIGAIAGGEQLLAYERQINAGGVGAQKALERAEKLLGKTITLADGKVTFGVDDIHKAAFNMNKETQFGFDPTRLPWGASDPKYALAFQMKSYSYNQAKLILNATIGEFSSGNIGRGTRNLLLLASIFPPAGLAVESLKNMLTGKESDTDIENVNDWLWKIADMGSFGLLTDLFRSRTGEGFVANLTLGPTAGTVADLYDIVKSGEPIEKSYEALLNVFGSAGKAVGRATTGEFEFNPLPSFQ